jgi:HAMP domain-containing protein
MVHELFYTSAERGLELGTSGFCTVARTRGLPKRLERLLHGLSVYKWDLRSGHNPVVYMYTRANLDGQSLFIVSRVAPAPADYSGRSNYFAHHVVLTASELPQAGPVWLLRQPGFLEQQWDGQVRELDRGRAVPQGNVQPRRCTTWERVTGDAGWAGLLLKYVSENPTAPVYLIADDSLPILDLLDEVIALLPIEKRWQVTFTTRYIQLPSEVSCNVRVVSPGSEKFAEAKASPRKVDLTALRGHKPADDPYTEAARLGQTVTISEPQYVVAQDEPFLPPGSAAFAQMSGGMPPPRASAVSANPSPTVAPMQPPQPPPIAPRSHTPFWLVLLVLLNLVLVAALGALFAIQQQNYRRERAELQDQFAKKLDEQTKNIKSELDDLRQQELDPLKQEAGQSKNLDERLKKLEGALNGLSGQISDVSKKLQQSGEDSKEKPKSEPDKATKELQDALEQMYREVGKLRQEVRELKQSLLRELTVRLHSRLTEDLRLVFSGKGDLPPAADIYEAQLYKNAEPVSDRAQQGAKAKTLAEVSLVRQFGDATAVSLVLALPAKPGAELELRSNLPQRLPDPGKGKDGSKSLEQFENFLQGLELRLVDRKGTVWLVKLECRLSDEDKKALLKQTKQDQKPLLHHKGR